MADEIATNFLSSMKSKGRKAMDWFKSIARKAQRAVVPGRTGRREIMDDRNTGITSSISIGRMYLFQYDAKWKEKLPYWDMFPLILPFDLAKGGFYGINLHYLPIPLRIRLLDRLTDFSNNTKFDKKIPIQCAIYFSPKFKSKVENHRVLQFFTKGFQDIRLRVSTGM